MPELDTNDLIERWRLVTAELDPGTAKPEWWQDEPVGHFLHAFRPDGARLPELFVGMPEMAPVLERLQIVFERAGVDSSSWQQMLGSSSCLSSPIKGRRRPIQLKQPSTRPSASLCAR